MSQNGYKSAHNGHSNGSTHNGHSNGSTHNGHSNGSSSLPELHCSNIFQVEGQVAVITGATSQVGSMIARSLASNGVKCYLVSRRKESVSKLCKEIEENCLKGRTCSDGQVVPIEVDLSNKQGAEMLCQMLQDQHKERSIDMLVNAAKYKGHLAGIGPGHNLKDIQEALWKEDQNEAERVVQTDLLGLYFTIVALLPLLGRSKHHPQVLTVAGVQGLVHETMGGLIEPATKAATIHMTKMFATLLAKTNIRCNVIAPGPFFGEERDSRAGGDMGNKDMNLTKELMGRVPAGRMGCEKDIGALILFLSNKCQSYVNGVIIPIDGGLHTVMPCAY
ncbi:hypothetical protein CROQUDRAFT_671907 [Cronartium quercuum f. sp. fusiforme G11]|uniref:Uncharacterized protein n=1 Tax=Cronartium quercuum f. sp. fusiforme G11 TaxID=708437 RepID=A0A9P6NJH9_9BASI|nr:hypothetical protein CROQUDRAFT_671907 [Cronartium quercuum f. sp. fusiforme G11]